MDCGPFSSHASHGEPGGKSRRVCASIVVPTLNEAENIDALLAAIFEHTAGMPAVEVVVVDDNSADGTAEKVRAWMATRPVRILCRQEPRGGLAGAVLEGARAARGEVIVVMDADLSHPPEALPRLLAPIFAGTHDLVIGSRYAPGGATPGWPLARRFASRLAAALAWPITDLRDALSGFFAVRRELLLSQGADSAGFKIGLELLVRGGERLRVAEVPITFRDRARGESKLGAGVLWSYLDRLLALVGAGHGRETRARFALTAAAGIILDLAVFLLLVAQGITPAGAHLASYGAAVTATLLLRRHSLAGWRAFGRFGFVCLMAVFLRGAVLALGLHDWGWPPQLAIVPAVAVGALMHYLGTIFFIAPAVPLYDRALGWRIAALGVVAYLASLRLVYLCLPNLLPEEAYYWKYGQHLALGYLDHPPMVAWLTRLGTELFGHTEFGVRIGAFLCWGVASFFLYRLTRELFSKTAGFIAVLLLQVLPFFFSTGVLLTPDAPLVACWAGLLFFLSRALLAGSGRAWWGVGAMLGLGLLSKYSIATLGAAALVFLACDRPSRRWFLNARPYLAVVLALAIFSPVIFWNAQNDWASFAFQTSRRVAAEPRFSLHALLGSILLLLTPVGAAAAALALARPGGEGGEARRRALFLRVFTLVPLAVFVFFSLRHRVQLNWTGPLWLAALPAVAAAIARSARPGAEAGPAWLRHAWTPTVAATVLLYGALLHYLALGLPGVGYSRRMELVPVGWAELGREVERLEDELHRSTGREPLVVGMDRYFTASELAFYRPDRAEAVLQAAGPHLFGGKALMYERWAPREAQTGRDLLLVAWNPEQISDRKIGRRALELGPIGKRDLVHGGKAIRPFYHRVAFGYGLKPLKTDPRPRK